MGRPRKFDRDEALQTAMQVFWSRGFEATSMTDLQKALGIGRQSLYATFGDKEELFDEALAHYLDMSSAHLDTHLGPEAGLDQIRAHLHDVAVQLTQGAARRGCLMVNTCVERAPHDERVAALTDRGMVRLRDALARAVENGRDRGELAPDTDPHATAAFLVSQIAGLGVLARTGATAAELGRIVDTTLSMLERSSGA